MDGKVKPDDLKSNRASANKPRFKDAPAGNAEDDARREELKQKLQEGIKDMMDLEKFRKSDDDVCRSSQGLMTEKPASYYGLQN